MKRRAGAASAFARVQQKVTAQQSPGLTDGFPKGFYIQRQKSAANKVSPMMTVAIWVRVRTPNGYIVAKVPEIITAAAMTMLFPEAQWRCLVFLFALLTRRCRQKLICPVLYSYADLIHRFRNFSQSIFSAGDLRRCFRQSLLDFVNSPFRLTQPFASLIGLILQ